MVKTKLKSPTPLFLGFLQATGIFVYILLLSLLMFNIEKIFSNTPDTFLAPVFVISLFVTSAMITASIAFYHPIINSHDYLFQLRKLWF